MEFKIGLPKACFFIRITPGADEFTEPLTIAFLWRWRGRKAGMMLYPRDRFARCHGIGPYRDSGPLTEGWQRKPWRASDELS